MNEEDTIDIYFEELKASNKLPSPSGVALEIIRLTQNPNCGLEDISRPIQSDPVLTGRLLKLANSSLGSTSGPVLSVKDALIKVGTQALTHLALSLSILDSNRIGACHAFDYDGFWATSLQRALSMQLLTEPGDSIKPEEAFTIGLCCEIGRLALAQIHPTRYAQCLLTNNRNLIDLEKEAFLITHEQITLQMMLEWGIPEWILTAVKASIHTTNIQACTDKKTSKLAAQLRLSTWLVGGNGIDHGFEDVASLLETLSLNYSALEQIRSKLYTEWRSWGELLFMPMNDDYDFWLQNYRGKTEEQTKAGFKILIVEDDRVERHLLCQYLTKQGYTVFSAENGEQALKEYILHRPQVVLTDYLMEPVDGLHVTRALRSNQDTQNVYIILITADKETEIMAAAFEAGVNDFILKPAQTAELNARIDGAKHFLRLQQSHLAEREIIRKEAVDFALAKRRFATLAITDPLTGLFNRRYANARLQQEWSFYTRHDKTFAILSLDLDFFKQVNDNYGHDVGDCVLQHFACILQQSIRSEDIPCRMGGEEFIVICPNIVPDMLDSLCERIRNRVEKQQPLELKLSRLITVSIGAAISDVSIDGTPSETLKRSDEALYAAKATGRNKYIVFERS